MAYVMVINGFDGYEAFSQGLGGHVFRINVIRSVVVPLLDASEEEVSFG